MKTEDGSEALHPWIEPELEARLTALVLGEASDFERDELERLVADRPELGLYRQRLEAMHRLLREVATGESGEEQGEWRLGAERREAVLARLGGEAPADSGRRGRSERRRPWSFSPRFIAVAATILIVGLMLGLMFPATTGALRKAQRPSDGESNFAFTKTSENGEFPRAAGASPQSEELLVAESAKSFGPNASIAELSDKERQAVDWAYADRAIRPPAPASPAPASPPIANAPDEGKASALGRSLVEIDDNRRLARSRRAAEPPAAESDAFSLGMNSRSSDLALSSPAPDDPFAAPRASASAELGEPMAERQVAQRGAAGFAFEDPAADSAPPTKSEKKAVGESSQIRRTAGVGGALRDGDRPSIAFAQIGHGGSIAQTETFGENGSIAPTGRTDGTPQIDQLAEADSSVQDILALTPQLNLNSNAGGIAWKAAVPEEQDGRTRFPISPQTPTSFESRNPADASSIEVVRELPQNHEPEANRLAIGLRSGAATISSSNIDELIANATAEAFEKSSEAPEILGIAGIATDPGFAEMRRQLQSLRQPTPAALDETSPSAEPFSTFSLHVSDVSFQLAKAALASGQWPEAEKIRIEEFVNAFDYGDPVPSMGERVACRIDQGAHPFLQQRNLVRIALRTAEAGRSSGTPLRLTLLLDSSGSMERPDRREALTRAVATLAGLLGENDRVTLVSFARQPRLVADAVPGNEAMKLAETVAALPTEGGTNLEAALELAFEKAREHQEANAQNRIVLLTDGAANLGDAKAESLGARVEMMRDAGIAFDAAGFGAEGLNDEILEALTRKGDGRYYLLDRPEDAGEAFAEQIAGALRPAAKNVKVQVEFNPNRVKSYKLLGFEKHRLATEDFRNDAVDAAELAAAEAGVAVYQVEPDPVGEGDLGSVSVRFRNLESGEMVERRWALPYLATAPAADQAGDAIRLATVASQFAAKLAGGPLGDVVDIGELARLAATLPDSPRVNELRTMIEQARGLEGDR